MIEPFNTNVLCHRVPDEEISQGGIILAQTEEARRKQKVYPVIVDNVGPDVGNDTIQAGDMLLVNKFTVEDIAHQGVKYGLVKEENICARIVDEAAQ